jgi:hypothetical protein
MTDRQTLCIVRTCTAEIGAPGRQDRWQTKPCGKRTDMVCAHCGEAICISCSLPCYQCGFPLHDECREEHEQKTGHQVELFAPVLGEAERNMLSRLTMIFACCGDQRSFTGTQIARMLVGMSNALKRRTIATPLSNQSHGEGARG